MNYPKAYCLTLPGSAHRSRAEKEFQRVGMEVKFWNGINGLDFGLKTFLPSHTDWFSGPKIIGIYLGHWILWRMLETVDADVFLVLEDDVEFHPQFTELWPVFYNELPADWKMAYVGACCVRNNQYRKVTDHLVVARNPMATHAYMIKREVLPLLIEKCACVRHPVDQDMMFQILPLVAHYTFMPSLAKQDGNLCFTDPDWIF